MTGSNTRPSVTIERARVGDIPQIMALERSPGYPRLVGSYDAVEHRRRLEAANSTYLLGRIESRLIGFAAIRFDDDGMATAQLHRIVVSPPGRGYGTSFMQAICEWVFAECDVERFWLDLLPSNVRAVRVYEKIGFEREGVMRSALRTPGGRQDLLLMSLLRADWQPPVKEERELLLQAKARD